FNTENERFAFEPRIIANLPADFYRRHFDYASAVEAGVDVLFPLRGLDGPIQVSAVQQQVPDLLQRTLLFPRLNRMANGFRAYAARGEYHPGAAWLNRPLREDYAQTFDELLELFARHNV